jgi:hypothetical protein
VKQATFRISMQLGYKCDVPDGAMMA